MDTGEKCASSKWAGQPHKPTNPPWTSEHPCSDRHDQTWTKHVEEVKASESGKSEGVTRGGGCGRVCVKPTAALPAQKTSCMIVRRKRVPVSYWSGASCLWLGGVPVPIGVQGGVHCSSNTSDLLVFAVAQAFAQRGPQRGRGACAVAGTLRAATPGFFLSTIPFLTFFGVQQHVPRALGERVCIRAPVASLAHDRVNRKTAVVSHLPWRELERHRPSNWPACGFPIVLCEPQSVARASRRVPPFGLPSACTIDGDLTFPTPLG
jgi:hypothetical protein